MSKIILFSEEESLGDSFSAIWEAHVQQLIPCSLCARTFFPDRIEVRNREKEWVLGSICLIKYDLLMLNKRAERELESAEI